MMKTSMKAGTKAKSAPAEDSYALSDELKILGNPDALPEEILDQLIFKLMSPFLPVHVLDPSERKQRINRIRYLISQLARQTDKKLSEKGQLQTAGAPDHYATLDSILSRVKDPRVQVELVNELREVQATYTPELLDALGFLPKSIFDRNEVQKLYSSTHEAPLADFRVGQLQELVPAWLRGKFGSLEELLDDLLQPGRGAAIRRRKLDTVPAWRRLDTWCHDTVKTVSHIQTTVLPTIERLLKVVRTERVQSSVLGGIDSRHLIELVKMVLDMRNSKRQRYEAYRTLYIIIAHYSLQSNPVFVAQQEVRARLGVLVGANIFDGAHDPSSMPVPDHVRRFVAETEFPDTASVANKNPFPEALRGREVSADIATVLSDSGVVTTPNKVAFDERGKTLESTTWKLILKFLVYLKCQALIEGKKTNLPSKYTPETAQAYIDELKKHRDFCGVKPEEMEAFFRSKPVSLQGAVDDTVGMSFSLNMNKPMHEYTEEERSGVNNMFANFADTLKRNLGLIDVRPDENYLWASNGTNSDSGYHFRLYKVHGFASVEVSDYQGGKPIKKIIKIPVEIQLRPVETQLRAHGDGETGAQRYKADQMNTLGEFMSPEWVYGPAHSHPTFEELEELLG